MRMAEPTTLPRGRFITFEGGEGTGKSTQLRLLAARIEALGIEVRMTREPGGTPGAEAVRHVLLSGAAAPLGPIAEAILFAAARQDHVTMLIEPALAAGNWVICDRFIDSTRIYQGELGSVDPQLIRALEKLTIGDTRPDLTIILDAPAYIGLARAARRRGTGETDRFESESTQFHEELNAAYRSLAQKEPDRCVLIDARGDPETVAESVWRVCEARFDLRRAPGPALAEAVS